MQSRDWRHSCITITRIVMHVTTLRFREIISVLSLMQHAKFNFIIIELIIVTINRRTIVFSGFDSIVCYPTTMYIINRTADTGTNTDYRSNKGGATFEAG